MLLLLLFSFLAGIVTILSPCILPILPIVLSGSVGGGRRKPLGIIIGFVLSFTVFTLFLSAIVRLTGLSADVLRNVSVVIILLFGITLLLPQFQVLMERLFSRLSGKVQTNGAGSGFWGGVLIGISLGLVWTPCVGPIIASVITLAATSSVNSAAIFITFAYSLGTAIPMFAIMLGGRALLQKVPWLLPHSGTIQKVFGLLMILTALGIFFQVDRKFQTYILTVFPEYGTGLTKIEDNAAVKQQLEVVKQQKDMPLLNLVGEKSYPDAPEIIPGGEWINSKPLKIKELKGKVVLIDFWTYTCINCIRTLPYLKDWHEKYADKGLVIIGVHTPEFEFEKNLDNVKKAVKDFGIFYPVVQDNAYATWQAYDNHYWPAKYFIDKNGKVRSTHFGEGEYVESEKIIQELLAETGSDVSKTPVNTRTYEIDANTPETYLGYGRMERFVSPEQILRDKKGVYTTPVYQPESSFAYGGSWTIGRERAVADRKADLVFHYSAKDVYLVMRSTDGKPVNVRVLLDEQVIPAGMSGKDVRNGVVTVTSDRLYHLVSTSSEGDHFVTLEFPDGRVEVYAFTFG